jgi:hypothetical protein
MAKENRKGNRWDQKSSQSRQHHELRRLTSDREKLDRSIKPLSINGFTNSPIESGLGLSPKEMMKMSYQDVLDVINQLEPIRVKLWEIARDLAKAEEKRRLEQLEHQKPTWRYQLRIPPQHDLPRKSQHEKAARHSKTA